MTEVTRILREEILQKGPLPFARFMEAALYCPNIGYYEKNRDVVGRAGDFYTSVTASPLFAELLAFQMAQWLDHLEGMPACLVEAGAHDGRLARGILAWIKQCRPQLLDTLQYWIVEPSGERKVWQARQVDEFARQIRWVSALEELPPVHGVIFSNELLDAMPVHRLAWHAAAREWQELGVAWSGEQFVWSPLPRPSLDVFAALASAGFHLPPELQQILPNGFVIEVSPIAKQWWAEAAAKLRQGRLLAIDYGLTAEQFLVPQRAGGTLRAYKDHHLVPDVLANPGEQDITAHINFTQLQRTGEAAGLKTESFLSQERFLGGIVRETMVKAGAFAEWSSQRVLQLQVLTHPEHLGRPFQVLVQTTP